MSMRTLAFGVAAATALSGLTATTAVAQDSIFVPLLSYRTGPFAGSGMPIADGMHDYLTHAQRARRRHRRRQES
jgi:branched-chain amino acid transport system substrate-binding protein